MKKNLIKLVSLTAVFALGIGVAIKTQKQPIAVEAAQHADNYADYTYSGNYYNSITGSYTEGLQGTLRKALSSLILPKAWYTYSGSSNGTLGKILQSADEDPTNSSNMVLFYTRDSISKRGSGGSTTDWNREHVWPQSLSNSHWGKEIAGADLLHIRPTWYTTNNTRANTIYADLNHTGVQKYEGMAYAYMSGNRFEPIDAVKGDVARILMYVWTAYYDYYKDSGLVVTKAIESYDVLLKWHTMDKPDALEGSRNDFAEGSNQKNRNPFVDHPEYAWEIFGDSASAEVKQACKEAYPAAEVPPVDPPVTSSEPVVESSNPIIVSSEPVISSAPESQEIIESSSVEELSSIEQPSSSTSEDVKPDKKKGCNGSIIASVSLVGFSSIIGLVFILSKKKE